jgi:hypothetical protein
MRLRSLLARLVASNRSSLIGATVVLGTLAACGKDSTGASDNPTPGITTLAPAEIEQGVAGQSLAISGSDFVSSSVVRVNGADRPTTFVSRSELRGSLSAADVVSPGTLQIVVVNPPPGGGTSNVALLVVRARANPVPAITRFVPPFLTTGSSGDTVTIEGTGFVQQSSVVVGFAARSGVTYVSPTQIRVAFADSEVSASGTLSLRVFNPPPGGGASNEVPLEIRAPAPTLTALGESQTTAGQGQYTLSVIGTGFVRNSVVRFNEAPRPTTFVNATTLRATLGEGDLRAAGTFNISVATPPPGGGTSNVLALQLVNGVPTITLLPSQGAHAGRPGFSLLVHGTGFVQGSAVHWNGTARSTQYVSSSRLLAEISAADVASPGTAEITVVTPAPGGGTSGLAVMIVRAVPAATATSTRALPLFGRDLAPDDERGLVYLSIAATAPLDANSLVALDPNSGTVTQRVFVGAGPGRVARSGDGQFLYVGLDGASAVRRVDLATFTAGLQWSLSAGEVAGEIKVVPGRPHSVAISRQSPGYSPPLNGVTIYDDGLPRPQSSPGHTGGNRIEFLDQPDTLYGYNNAHTGFEFFTISIDEAGARHAFATGGLIAGFYTQITGAAGRIYGTDGSIVDAERRVKVGSFPTGTASMTVAPALGRAFMLQGDGIAVYDLNNYQLLGTVPVSGYALDHPALAYPHLVRWGSDGVAFLDTDEVFLVRSPLFAP